MRGRALCVAAISAALFSVLGGGAVGASKSSVSGSGTGHFAETGGPFSLFVNGRGEGPLAQGYVRGSGGDVDDFEGYGPLTCLRVEGNRASVKSGFKRAAGPGAPPQSGGVQVYKEDNGRATGGQPVDR